MKNKIILALLLVFSVEAFAQTVEEKNLEKYWFYRERLEQYYMVMGKGAGEGLPAVGRNSYKITFFIVKPPYELDTTIYAGGNQEHYTIATELKFEEHKDIDIVDVVWFKIK